MEYCRQNSNFYTENPDRNLFIAVIRESLFDAIYTDGVDTFRSDDENLLFLCECAGLNINVLIKFKELVKKRKVKRKSFNPYFSRFLSFILETETDELILLDEDSRINTGTKKVV